MPAIEFLTHLVLGWSQSRRIELWLVLNPGNWVFCKLRRTARSGSKALLAGIVCIVAFAGNCPKIVIGRVLDSSGDWKGAEGQAVIRGSPVCSDSKFRNEHSGSAFLELVYVDGRHYSCGLSGKNVCKSEEPRPTSAAAPSNALKRLGLALEQVLNESSTPIVFASVRGEASGPTESVLKVEAGTLDLGPTLSDLPNGQYTAEFSAAGDHGGFKKAGEASVVRKGAKSCLVALSLRPGIYRVRLLTADTGSQAGSPAVVLIVNARRYQSVSNDFEEVKVATQKAEWNSHEDALHYAWTLYLYSLDRRGQSP